MTLTSINICNEMGQLDTHDERPATEWISLGGWQRGLNLFVAHSLGKTHERGHLSVQHVDCPPYFPTPLDMVCRELAGGYVRVHALAHG